MIGKTVSHYRILEKLGSGGMGVVYRAEDTKLKRIVALKFLPEELSRDRNALERFEREAQAASALSHPNICTIHDIDEHQGQRFIAMELLEGQTLKERLHERPLPTPEIVDVGLQLTDALEAAHAKGIIHRDIKPANVFVTERRTAKLLDFGLAKLAEPHPASEASTAASDWVTGAGVALGTVGYMSPEQVRGDALDARSDLFSLGVLLYEMSTGMAPFRGATSGTVLSEILTKAPVAPVRLNPEVPPELERIVDKLLEKDRALRYQSARDLSIDLERLRRTLSASTAARAEKTSIIVLPFEDISPESDNEYFADGLTEEVITDLSHVGSLRVISRTSAMMFKGARKAAQDIGRELGVRYLLEGSVRKAGNKLRITAQLIDTATDAHIWADKYAGTLDDVFDMQEQVSRAIVAALQMKLTVAEDHQLSCRPIRNAGIFDLYLRARKGILQATKEGLGAAVRLLEDGLRMDPDTALLVAGLGYAHVQTATFGFAQDEALEKASALATHALQLDPEMAQAHLVLGLVACHHGDHRKSVRELGLAISLEPAESDSLYWLGIEYVCVGRTAAVAPVIDRMRAVDPLHPYLDSLRSWAHWVEGRFDQAAGFAERCRPRYDNNPIARFKSAFMLVCAGQGDAALALLDPVAETATHDVTVSACKFLRLALRREAAALPALLSREFVNWARRDLAFSYLVAACYMIAGESELGLDWLGNAVDRGFIPHPYFRDHEPFFSKLRGDPRFEALMVRIKREWEEFDV